MPYADLNGQRIFYEDSGGDGPPIVLGHGFLMDLEMFDPQVRALVPEFRVIRFDGRGFGQTPGGDRPFSYWDLADDCAMLLSHLGIERAVVGGMSQGGFLSLRFALRHPDRVKALVLIDTAADLDDERTLAGHQMILDTWKTQGPVNPLLHQIAALILGPPERFEDWLAKWRKMPQDALVLPGRCLLERDDITARLSEIRCPALVVHGAEDMAIQIHRGEALVKGLSGCKGFVRVDAAAHAPNLTHPERINPALLEFLRTYA